MWGKDILDRINKQIRYAEEKISDLTDINTNNLKQNKDKRILKLNSQAI